MTRTDALAIRATVGAVVAAVRAGAHSAQDAEPSVPMGPVTAEHRAMLRGWSDGYGAGWAAASTLAQLTAADAIAELDRPPD